LSQTLSPRMGFSLFVCLVWVFLVVLDLNLLDRYSATIEPCLQPHFFFFFLR
jgi:hypothetical protein